MMMKRAVVNIRNATRGLSQSRWLIDVGLAKSRMTVIVSFIRKVKQKVQGSILLWISAVCVSIQNKVEFNDHMATLFWYEYLTTVKVSEFEHLKGSWLVLMNLGDDILQITWSSE